MIRIMGRELIFGAGDQRLGTDYDGNSAVRVFKKQRSCQDGVDLAELSFYAVVHYSDGGEDTISLQKSVDDKEITLEWDLSQTTMSHTGFLFVWIRGFGTGGTVRWSSYKAVMYIEDSGEDPDVHEYLTLIEQIIASRDEMQDTIDSLMLQFQNAVAALTEDSEVQNARIGHDNVLYRNLKERLDTEHTDLKNDIESMYHDTVAQMITDTTLESGMYVRTGGYHAVNDKGGALYRIESTAPNTYYETLSSGLYAELLIGAYVTPQMFGAYGDETHDDTNALQNAIDYCDNVIIPYGAYSVTSIIINRSGVTVTGQRLPTIKSVNGNDAVLKIGNASSSIIDILVEGIRINGNGADCVNWNGVRVSRTTIRKCRLDGFGTNGINIQTATGYCYIEQVSFFSASTNAVYINMHTSGQTIPINYIWVRNCYFEAGTSGGAQASPLYGIHIGHATDIFIEGNDFANFATGTIIDITSVEAIHDIYIRNNVFFNIFGAVCINLYHGTESSHSYSGIFIDGNGFFGASAGGGTIVTANINNAEYIYSVSIKNSNIRGKFTTLYNIACIDKLTLDRVIFSDAANTMVASNMVTYTSCRHVEIPPINTNRKQVTIAAGGSDEVTFDDLTNIPWSLYNYIAVLMVPHGTSEGIIVTSYSADNSAGTITVSLTNTAAGPRTANVGLN